MNAITVWQPWAHAIAYGPKRVENRTWRPWASAIGQPLAVHAAVRRPRAGEEIADLWPECPPFEALHYGAVLAVARLAAVVPAYARADDPWAVGPWCWVLDDVKALAVPVHCRGEQGIWRLSPNALRDVARQVGVPR